MAIWRDAALEGLVGGPLDPSGLTEAAILGLVTQSAREGEQLDFKLKPHLPEPSGASTSSGSAGPAAPTGGGAKAWKPEQEWAKDVCQFANHRGGLLLVGVDETDDVATDAKPTVIDPAALEQRLRAALANYTAPTPRVEIIAVPAAAGGNYLAVAVPPSERSPHAVTSGPGANRKSLVFPVRHGADTRWMDEAEVADRYRLRSLARLDRAAAMSEMVDVAAEQLGLTTELWLYVALNPESPAGARLDGATVEQIRKWHGSYGFSSPLSRGIYSYGQGIPGPGRVTFTGQHAHPGAEATDPRDGYVELYADGRAFAAKPVTFDTAREGQVGLMTIVDDTTIILDLALSWSLHQAGSGTVDIQAGFVANGALESPYSPPLSLHIASGQELHRLANTRLVRRPVRALTTADLGSCDTPQGRMAVVHDVASALLQHFGLADADMIEPDGTLIGSQWGNSMREVEKWASDREVPFRIHPH